jgi:tetratricopeptide (TPR) repeat protein
MKDKGPPSPLNDVDSAERVQLVRITVLFGPPCFVILSALWWFLNHQGVIPDWLMVVLLVLNVPLTALGVYAIHRGTSEASVGLVKTLYAVGDIAPPRTYPRQDVLLVRGQYREAAEYFRDHLTIEPDDNEARLRLADVLEQHLDDPGGAEQLYVEVRRHQPDRGHAMRATNGLIDLYRKQGKRDRMMVELARFRDGYPGTPEAAAAARLLNELKADS